MSNQYQKIMVTLDGSAFADQALPHAEQLATALGAELILFRVVPNTDGFLPNPSGYPTVLRKELIDESTAVPHGGGQDENPIDTVERALENLAEGLRRHNLEVRCVVDAGSPSKKIINYLQHNDVDLLVMSTHGRSGVARALFGSVAQEVYQKAECPILLVKAKSDSAGHIEE